MSPDSKPKPKPSDPESTEPVVRNPLPGREAQAEVEVLVTDCLLARATRPARVLVGFSGGVDSTALLLACAGVMSRILPNTQLSAIHIHHGVQVEADAWQEHCQKVCRRLNVSLSTQSVQVSPSGNFEANARAERYRVFSELLGDGDLLLLGHHQEDQTETVLYRLFQGRGLMPMRDSGVVGQAEFARPLLAVSPAALRAYVLDHGLSWVEDPSNRDISYARNFLRAEVLPLLRERWSQLHEAVGRVIHAHAATADALAQELAGLGDEVDLGRLPEGPARIAWLRAYLHSRGDYAVSDRALLEFVEQINKASQAHLQVGSSAGLYAHAGVLYYAREVVGAGVEQSIRGGESLQLPGGRLSLIPAQPDEALAIACDGPLRISYRQGGERISDVRRGATLQVKKLFNEAGIPPWRRQHYPLLFAGDTLVCVPGLASASDGVQGGQQHWIARWEAGSSAH